MSAEADSLLKHWKANLFAAPRWEVHIGVTPKSKALTPEQQRIQELEARCERLERENSILKRLR